MSRLSSWDWVRHILFRLCICILTGFAALPSVCIAGEIPVLVIANWSDYLDPAVVAAFEAEFEVDVRIVYFTSEAERDAMMADSEGRGLDLAVVDGIRISPYAQNNWIRPISVEELPNISAVSPEWLNKYPMASSYAVPFLWGAVGLAYRRDRFSQAPVSWMDLFAPDGRACGHIIMQDDPQLTIQLALLAQGKSPSNPTLQDLAAVAELLHAQRDCVIEYAHMDLDDSSEMVDGSVWLAPQYSGDAVMLNHLSDEVQFVYPQEGTVIWCDYLVVMTHAREPELALAFINFLNRPDIAAQVALFGSYPTPNDSARSFLPDWFLTDSIINPPAVVMEKAKLDEMPSTEVIRRRNEIYAQVSR